MYLVALIRPYVPVIFFGAFVLGSAGGGMDKTNCYNILLISSNLLPKRLLEIIQEGSNLVTQELTQEVLTFVICWLLE